MGLKRIVETGNNGSVFTDERFLNIRPLPEFEARIIAEEMNKDLLAMNATRLWKVVDPDYQLQPGCHS